MTACEDKPPIFIVGVPRSGTTLLAAMLAAHSQLSCGPETRFFRFLAKDDVARLCAPQDWPETAVNFLFSMLLVDVPVPEHFGVTREQIRSYLDKQPPSVPAMLASLTEQFMQGGQKSRWVEKSPEHLAYVSEIRNYFPVSPIVRIVRDPRDTALSMVKAPWGPDNFLDALMLWSQYDRQSAAFFETDKLCYTIYYEDLVQKPQEELVKLCDFLGEVYEPQMLDTSRSASSVVTEKDSWHRIVHKPVDTTRIQVWKRQLSQEQKRVAEALVGDRLLVYDYECTEKFDSTAVIYPALETLLKYEHSLHSLVDAGSKFWGDGQERTLTVYVGEPDQDKWLSYGKIPRWRDTFYIIFKVVNSKFTRRPIYWARNRVLAAQTGRCSRLLLYVFQLSRIRQIM